MKDQKDTSVVPEKLYYSISEVARITEVKPYVLRFWEKEFPNLHPKKNRSGNRIYQAKEIELIKQIKHLLYDKGFTIDGARQQLRQGRKKSDGSENGRLRESVSRIRAEIEDILKLLS